MPGLRGQSPPNVAVPQGAIYPNGIEQHAAKPEVQATVRPEGAVFRSSPGYETVRPGNSRLSPMHPHGPGIHFTPLHYAEDVAHHGEALMVNKDTAADHVDVANLPGSDNLDAEGRAQVGSGLLLSEGTGSPTGGGDIRESEKTIPDMGDRTPGRPLTGAFWRATLHNPIGMFRDEYRQRPLYSIVLAGGVIGLAYAIGTEAERQWTRRSRGRGPVGAVGTAPAAGVAAAGASVAASTKVVDKAVTEAGEAAAAATDAAGDAAKAAGEAVEATTKATADAAS